MAPLRAPARPWALCCAVLLGIAGIVDCQCILVLHCFPGGQEALGCAGGSGCARLLSSRYAAPAGVPLELVGVLAFGLVLLLLAATSLCVTARWRLRLGLGLQLLTGAMVLTCGALMLLAHHLAASCPYCRTAAMVICLLAIAVWLWLPGVGADPWHRGEPEDLPAGAATLRARVAPWLLPLLVLPLLLVGAVDALFTVQAHAVVLRSADVALTRLDLRRIAVGPEEAGRLVRREALAGYAQRRLALHAVERSAADRQQSLDALLTPLRALPPAQAEAGLAALVRTASDGGGRDQLQPGPIVAAPGDWSLAIHPPGQDTIGAVRLLLAIDATCPVCASEIRELAWTLARLPAHPAVGVLIAVPREDPTAAAIAAALDVVPPESAWPLLVGIMARADPGTWDATTLARMAHTRTARGSTAAPDAGRVAARTQAVERLCAGRPRPQLFLDGRRLGGFCPRETLCGVCAEAEATTHAAELLPDLAGFASPTTSTSAATTVPIPAVGH